MERPSRSARPLDPFQGRALLEDWEWQEYAACRGMDAAVFFSPFRERGAARRAREERARAVCRACPVRPTCAEFAVQTTQAYGVWGGLTEDERLALSEHRQDADGVRHVSESVSSS